MSSVKGNFLDNMASAVRENPLAAALIGGGALWLLAGNERLKNVANSASGAVSPLVDISARNVSAAASRLQRNVAPPTAPEMDNEGSFHVGESLRDAAGAVVDTVSGTTDKIKNHFDDAATYTREKMGKLSIPLPEETFAKAKSSLAQVLEGQPLVLGVIGIAIGATVAGAFGISDLENKWIGEMSDDVKGDLSARAGAVSESIREASDTLKSEFSDTAAEATDRVKQAGLDAANAARDVVKSP